ncbi:tyrosine-type recombinase/integrase [Streptococcus suis]|uniref:Integrase n=2 Tax=Streptococcus TaxID=1301 RepID=A0A0Z8JU26_STRSU|nr:MULTISPECIES: tyrosine-type recombinase/integrase [Streptococcus]EGJ26908.1 phage integrase, N-terminal SAM domain protein [Streptococcus porcinus str. Jelinkova 176]MDN2989273.1 tyrosine-type recombinase/integrase [Streptococcus suis]MDN2990805.1 tyrosine-type recombinase/integrase [Streptococcus suis]MDS1313758.1 tyrosine-type recombinase/integrase [Streptococcus suis]NQG73500.1 tyrosine-type recombinase/integrase [Streptococcus suis]
MDYTIISTYLDYCKTHKRLSSHTLRAYKNDLIQFCNSDHDCVVSYIEYLTNSAIKTNTLRRKIASLKVFYSYLMTQNIISENPFNQLRFQFRTEKTLPKIIPHNILKNLYAYLKQKVITSKTNFQRQKAERNLLIVSILLSTGIRISELCHIQIKNINLQNQTLHIFGKGKKERIIFLGDETTVLLLKTYLANYCNQSDKYLFPGKFSQNPLTEQSVRLVLKTVRKQMNLATTITPHMFRHSFATMLLDNDVDIRYIQQILGHSSISITQIYTHVSQSKQKEILTSCNPIASVHN